MIALFGSTISCKQNSKLTPQGGKKASGKILPVHYAKGFKIETFEAYKEVQIRRSWPDDTLTRTYYLVHRDSTLPSFLDDEQNVIRTPVQKLVATSTTDIPALEMLEIEDRLIGFPNHSYISSSKTRKRIKGGFVEDLGSDTNLNIERTLALEPDLIIGFLATGESKTYDQIRRFGVPVIYNGSWMEQHPLGRAEWIKFIAAFFNKEELAVQEFKKIESSYVHAAQKVLSIKERPVVLSGSMYKDIWYVPGGDSFIAKIFQDAQASYPWETNNQTGSLQLSFESILDKAQKADFWFTGSSMSTLEELRATNNRYELFEAFQTGKVYTHGLKKGSTGGLIYYEEGSLRPDIVLKDMIKILHPQILPEHELYFYQKLL